MPDLLKSVNGRCWFFAALYVSEGAPMGFIWWALPTLLARQGVALADITALTSTVTLPWVFKFMAGPVIDASAARGGTLRHCILACQSAMILTLLPVAFVAWAQNLSVLTACLMVHAVFAATQDVAIDTLAIRSVPTGDLGRINGWMQAGMLVGRAAIAGGALLILNLGGQAALIGVLAILIALPAILVMAFAREPPPQASAASSLREGLAIVGNRIAIVGLLIALVAGCGFEFLGVAAGPLMVEFGSSDGTVSLFYGLLAPAGLTAGALVGGLQTDRVGVRRATGLGVVAAAVLVAALAVSLASWLPDPGYVLPGWLVVIYVGIGFLTTASYALFMRLAQGRYSATRFSLFMAATNGCEAWAGFVGGRLTPHFGYPMTILTLAVASLIALPLLRHLARAQHAAPESIDAGRR